MRKLYTSPLRVYLLLGLLALLGLVAGLQLPISLYPNSNKPTIGTGVNYGNLTAREFVDNYGKDIEHKLEAIKTSRIEVIEIKSHYDRSAVWFEVVFKWGTEPKEAIREVESTMNSLSSRWPSEVRDSLWTNYWAKSRGFVAVSFFSSKRTIDEMYDILEPLMSPELAKIDEASEASLWNPNKKRVIVELKPQVMATLGIFPRQIESAIQSYLGGFQGGTVIAGPKKLAIQMPRPLNSIEDVKNVLVATPGGATIPLAKVAHIALRPSDKSNRIFKTNGSKSLILFAEPRSGGNVKKMAEDVIQVALDVHKKVPKDIEYRILVDPSEFIREAVNNVFHEVLMAAGLAVLVLFLFVGSFKNTITAAIEIPLSMVLAFILMKWAGMNINLISLGGLALSAGMNVDASVVVMENIFRFMKEKPGKLGPRERLDLVIRAVKEVGTPIIGATIASLVVFLPLALTSDLTNAILGDLAKAVVFSHGFSAIVALILVPTIRLHIMARAGGMEKPPESPIEDKLQALTTKYVSVLKAFILSKKTQIISFSVVVVLFLVSVFYFAPNLRREIIGTPDTDWMVLSINTSGNTMIKQMEDTTDEIEHNLLKNFGDKIDYTFVQVRRPNRSTVMAKLKNKKDMETVWKKMEDHFTNTTTLFYWVGPWNPAELPIPDPPHLRVAIRGGSTEERALVAQDFLDHIRKDKPFDNVWAEPGTKRRDDIIMKPRLDMWPELAKRGARFRPGDLAELSRVATDGKTTGEIALGEKTYQVILEYPKYFISTKEDIEALPIKVDGKIVPMKALADISFGKALPNIYRENGRDLLTVQARVKKGEDEKIKPGLAKAEKQLLEYQKDYVDKLKLTDPPRLILEDAQKELTDALKQLGVAIALSMALIFFVLVFQFGHVFHSIIVMSAIPLGIMGVVGVLYIFDSTLSLNSALGVILLNGIAVANSIILVDFIKGRVESGMPPLEAALEAASKRLRPILITSLTTVLGMLPIALGMGEGGKILQPLGLAVSGGLWVSTLFTLFVVPALEVAYYNWALKRNPDLLDKALSYGLDEIKTEEKSTSEEVVIVDTPNQRPQETLQ